MNNEQKFEGGLTFTDIAFLFKRNIILIITVIFIFVIVGGTYAFKFKKISYSASVITMVAIDTTGTNPGTTSYQYANYLTSTFSDFILSEPIISATRIELETKGYKISNGAIKNSVSTTFKANSLILKINATTGDPKLTRTLVNEIVDQAVKRANSMIPNPDVTDSQLLIPEFLPLYNKLSIVEKVVSDEDVVGQRGAAMVLIVSFILGCLISAGIVLVKYLLDDTYTSKEEFEKIFNINILAALQETQSEIKEGGN